MFETLERREVLASVTIPADTWSHLTPGKDYAPGELMVRFQDSVTPTQRQDILSNAKVRELDYWPGLHMSHVIQSSPVGQSGGNSGYVDATAAYLNSYGTVMYAEPNFTYHVADTTPNDPFFPQQWYLHNTGQGIPGVLNPGVPQADINIQGVWDTTQGNSNEVVAVIDTGIDVNHPDLVNNLWQNPGEIPNNGIDDEANGFVDDSLGWNFVAKNNNVQDDEGHGTAVAGVIGAEGNNSLGIAGENWHVQIMALKSFDAAGIGFSSTIVGALQYILQEKTLFGVNIVAANGSYSGPQFSFAESDAITKITDAGVVMSVAAGNSASNDDAILLTPAYPASYALPGEIAAAATDNTDQLTFFSNFGPRTVGIAAPGDTILTTYPQAFFGNTGVPGYVYISGTSFSAPLVTGAVAILRSLDPSLTNDQVISALKNGSHPLPSLKNKVTSGGRLDLAGAVDKLPKDLISGSVYLDENANGKRDAGETGLPGYTVFVDLNNNGKLDTREPFATTAADGSYTIGSPLGQGNYVVRQIQQPGLTNTSPANGLYNIHLNGKTDIINNLNFGNRFLPSEVHGHIFTDPNNNGVQDPGEPGMPNVVIYVDINNSGKISGGDPAAVTDANGDYTILNVIPGVYTVREVFAPGFVETFPSLLGASKGAETNVVVNPGQITYNINFGNKIARSWGLAPAPYLTTAAEGGASHGVLPGFGLGSKVSADADGRLPASPSDEDGVSFQQALVPGQDNAVIVKISTSGYSSGLLQGWIDFNGNGSWTDPGEQIISNMRLDAGTYRIPFTVPANAMKGVTWARFRYGYETNLGPTGPSLAGEVEDIRSNVLNDTPVAIDDSGTGFEVKQSSLSSDAANALPVLANDIPSLSGNPQILSFGTLASLGSTIGSGDHNAVDAVGNVVGTLKFDGTVNPAVIRYQPTDASFSGTATFYYTVWDGVKDSSGNPAHISAPAKVSVVVDFVPKSPIAVNDEYDITPVTGVTSYKLVDSLGNSVTANDIPGNGGKTLHINNTGPITTLNGGTATPDATNTFFTYTPKTGFTGSDSFSYTVVDDKGQISNPAGNPIDHTPASAGRVWIQYGKSITAPLSTDVLKIELKYYNANSDGSVNLASPITSNAVNSNSDFYVVAFTTDIRTGITNDLSGAVAAYTSLLYPTSLVQADGSVTTPTGSPIINPYYESDQDGSTQIPGLFDSAGGTHASLGNPPGPGSAAIVLFMEKFTALNTHGTALFQTDPPDTLPRRATYVLDSNGLLTQALQQNIVYGAAPQLTIGGGEGEFTNFANPLDVNRDGTVASGDVLDVVNFINLHGIRSMKPMDLASAGIAPPADGLDVTGDGRLNTSDVLTIVNYINTHPHKQTQAPAGEDSAAPSTGASIPVVIGGTPLATGGAVAAEGEDTGSSADPVFATHVDQFMKQLDISLSASSDTASASNSTSKASQKASNDQALEDWITMPLRGIL